MVTLLEYNGFCGLPIRHRILVKAVLLVFDLVHAESTTFHLHIASAFPFFIALRNKEFLSLNRHCQQWPRNLHYLNNVILTCWI